MRRLVRLHGRPLIRMMVTAASLVAASAAIAQTATPAPAPAGPAPSAASQPAAPPPPSPSEPAPVTAPPPAVTLPPEEPAPAPDIAPTPPPPVVAQSPKEPEPPAKRARYDVAILQAIDKITAETVRFEAAVGKPVRYKSLVFTVKACERSTDDELTPDAIAYLTIESQPKAAPGKPTPAARQAFKGWMFASSPGLNPLEHPVYDAWLITCRAASPS